MAHGRKGSGRREGGGLLQERSPCGHAASLAPDPGAIEPIGQRCCAAAARAVGSLSVRQSARRAASWRRCCRRGSVEFAPLVVLPVPPNMLDVGASARSLTPPTTTARSPPSAPLSKPPMMTAAVAVGLLRDGADDRARSAFGRPRIGLRRTTTARSHVTFSSPASRTGVAGMAVEAPDDEGVRPGSRAGGSAERWRRLVGADREVAAAARRGGARLVSVPLGMFPIALRSSRPRPGTTLPARPSPRRCSRWPWRLFQRLFGLAPAVAAVFVTVFRRAGRTGGCGQRGATCFVVGEVALLETQIAEAGFDPSPPHDDAGLPGMNRHAAASPRRRHNRVGCGRPDSLMLAAPSARAA